MVLLSGDSTPGCPHALWQYEADTLSWELSKILVFPYLGTWPVKHHLPCNSGNVIDIDLLVVVYWDVVTV